MRANSGDDGDEWDASYHPTLDPPRENEEAGMRWISDAGPAHHPTVARSETAESVQLSAAAPVEASHSHETSSSSSEYPSAPPALDTTGAGSRALSADHFVVSPTSMKSGVTLPGEMDADDRRFSVQSGRSANGAPTVRSMRKFENGTKFKESLDF